MCLKGRSCCRFYIHFVESAKNMLSFETVGISVEISNAMYMKMASLLRLIATINSTHTLPRKKKQVYSLSNQKYSLSLKETGNLLPCPRQHDSRPYPVYFLNPSSFKILSV